MWLVGVFNFSITMRRTEDSPNELTVAAVDTVPPGPPSEPLSVERDVERRSHDPVVDSGNWSTTDRRMAGDGL